MRKCIIVSLLIVAISLSLVGCSDKNNKIVNNSIIYDAKIISLEPYGYRNSGLKLTTDKGDFYLFEDDRLYFEQIKDLYHLKDSNDNSLFMDIIYDNSTQIDKGYEIVEVVIKE